MAQYDHKKIEKKWQKKWAEEGIYKTSDESDKPKEYVLDMFPYPSGEGLHVGHPKGYIATDIYSRYKKMRGFNVLHPMGWDAFGLPAENYALKNKVHPRQAVEKNIARYKEQLSIIGFNYDWDREINTTDPEYYKWTQWIFLKLFKAGLAYESNEPINWCPSCKTGLANEDLDNGACERCGSAVEKKRIRQWVLRITDYAERLLNDLDELKEWPDHIKELQRNWIGKSEGAEIEFRIAGRDEKIKVFTTRPDTLFGATYMVLAPEHPLVLNNELGITNYGEVKKYIEEAGKKSEIERTAEGKEKTGVLLKGIKAINPANKEEIPIFIADYVLADYGTGAIMAVPAHDERDFAFAKKYWLPVKEVVQPSFLETKSGDAVKENLPFKERNAVQVIIKHWSEEKYLCLKWKKANWITFVVGGIENGETPKDAALREMTEETGYKNFKLIKELGVIHSKFYHSVKQENRSAHFFGFLFQLKDGEQIELTEEEGENHELVWLSPTEVEKNITHDDIKIFWNRATGKETAYTGAGAMANSDKFNGFSNEEAKQKITEFVGGKMKTTYKLRDWVFSRQRYWGEPIPLIHCEKCGVVPVPEKDLPVKLPEVEHYEPTGTGESPLANISEWVNVPCPKCSEKGKRETNTMPQWAGSSWYYLRYIDPHNDKEFASQEKLNYWLGNNKSPARPVRGRSLATVGSNGVDMYVGGAEHATRHLIYARFWHKFLYDQGFVSQSEPFMRLKSPGLIAGADGRKMSKRFGNVINPDDVVGTYGADTLRLHEMFMGPFEQGAAWSEESIIGPRRFVEKVWRLKERIMNPESGIMNDKIESLLHQTIKKVTKDIEQFKFNTAISALMVLANEIEKKEKISMIHYSKFLILLSPFAPHVTEELWRETLGNKTSIHLEQWPNYDESKIVPLGFTITVQVNGKVRDTFAIEAELSEDEVKDQALALEKIKKWIDGQPIKKIIYVKNKIVNIVI